MTTPTPKQRLIEAVMELDEITANELPENQQYEFGYSDACEDFLELIEEILE